MAVPVPARLNLSISLKIKKSCYFICVVVFFFFSGKFQHYFLGMSQLNAQYAWESRGVCNCCAAAGNSPWELRALSFPLLTSGKGEYPKQEGSVLWKECSSNPVHHWTPEEIKLQRNCNVNTARAREITDWLERSRENTEWLKQPATEGATGGCHLK